MPYALIQDLHGAGLDEYDRVLAEVGDDSSPGLILRVAGPTSGGWRTIDVWQSRSDFERFHAERLLPALERSGIDWFGRWVAAEELAVHHMVRG